MGEENLIDHIKITVKRGYNKAPLRKICESAKESVETKAGIEGAKFQLKMYVEEAELLEKQLNMANEELEKKLYKYLTTRKENSTKEKTSNGSTIYTFSSLTTYKINITSTFFGVSIKHVFKFKI